MISKLTHWSLNRVIPTIDDTESLSVLELVGRNTTKINELINEYNMFVDTVNKEITDFESTSNSSFKCFTENIVKVVHEFIHSVELKLDTQDTVIQDAINFMKDNIASSVTTLINEMKDSGELDEVVLNALGSIEEKYQALLLAVNNHDLIIDELKNTEYKLVYNDTTEELMLQKSVNGKVV